ncbi:hypothetical protein [Streptomyces sp. NPDC057702]|uniref:allene oxide cyclase barrel-like domain-containing protein n=1 Tax=unclassified Streptomyces TaxID=2593676 RepID=UPI0036C226B2
MSLAAAAVGVYAVDGADAHASAPDRNRVEVIDIKLDNEQYADTDLGPKGPSLGDMNAYSGSALRDGRRVGLGAGSCQVVHVDGGKVTNQCVITIELDDGSLTMQSLAAKGASTLDMAITGGTGDYDDARGTAHYQDIATPNETVQLRVSHR